MGREPVTTVEELDSLDQDEIMEGYRDGRAGDDEPGDNRSKAYWHGWRNGQNDRHNRSDTASRALVRSVRSASRDDR